MAERILMIDDDNRLAGMVSDYLGGAGFRVTIANTGREGEAMLKRDAFDAVILDLMLPDADGLDLCRRLRSSTDVPILMLTARGEPMDRVVGLEVGADDYLAKP
ncbi:MAG: response regulator, partial [Reyranella sp.]